MPSVIRGQAVDAFDRRMGVLQATFAGVVQAYVGVGSVCGGADSTDSKEFAGLFVMTESLAVRALAIGVDGKVLLKAAGGGEMNTTSNSNRGNSPVSSGGTDHQRERLGLG